MAKECLTGPGTASQTVRFGFCLSSLWRLGQFFWARLGPACNIDRAFLVPELAVGLGVSITLSQDWASSSSPVLDQLAI